MPRWARAKKRNAILADYRSQARAQIYGIVITGAAFLCLCLVFQILVQVLV